MTCDRVGGGVTPAVLPHHRAYGSVHGGSRLTRLCCPECLSPYKRPTLPRGFRPLLPVSGSLTGHLLRVSRKQSLPCTTGSALHRVVRPTNMASADFCRPIPTPCDAGSTRQVDRSPRVRRVTFLPHTRRIYSTTLPDDYRALKIMASSPGWHCLVCDSCSSGWKFACSFLQIPPRGGHPCCSANSSRHQGP